MADATENTDVKSEPLPEPNPHVTPILEDVNNRSEWARLDLEIIQRRRGRRKTRKTKPYPGAPNTVVPIVDDVTREKTDQEITMTRNTPLIANFIPLTDGADMGLIRKAEIGFDSYMRFVARSMSKLEEGMDIKNARGMVVFKVFRSEDDRFGTIPDFDAWDPRDVIVPFYTKDFRRADRVTFVLRLSEQEIKGRASSKSWRNVEALISAAKRDDRETAGRTNEEDYLSAVKNLVGLTTSGPSSATIVVWEHYHYATAWDVKQDPSGSVIEGRRCVTIFSPDAPDIVLAIYPWREADTETPLTPPELVAEAERALIEGRPVRRTRTEPGKDRPWPGVQCRYDKRGYYYDTRGIGHLCMDDQIVATAQQNAKLTLLDYYQQPLLSGNVTHGTNISFEPGSKLPEGVKFLEPPQIPSQFDFDIEMLKRSSARRGGALSMYEFSGDVTAKKRIQKTATEVVSEGNRAGMMSSASVDRFNDPLIDLFQQVWDDLRRLNKPLPLISNDQFTGTMPLEVYGLDVLIVPAASAKTLNPDAQFTKAQNALVYLWQFKDFVSIDLQRALEDTFGHWDPVTAARWLLKPEAQGPQGQPPVYQLISKLFAAVKTLVADNQDVLKQLDEHGKVLERVAKLSLNTADNVDGGFRMMPPEGEE
jgi:hypothetical protein